MPPTLLSLSCVSTGKWLSHFFFLMCPFQKLGRGGGNHTLHPTLLKNKKWSNLNFSLKKIKHCTIVSANSTMKLVSYHPPSSSPHLLWFYDPQFENHSYRAWFSKNVKVKPAWRFESICFFLQTLNCEIATCDSSIWTDCIHCGFQKSWRKVCNQCNKIPSLSLRKLSVCSWGTFSYILQLGMPAQFTSGMGLRKS